MSHINRTAIVLGAGGFLGSAIVNKLKLSKFNVVCIARNIPKLKLNDPTSTWIELDIAKASTETWSELFQGADLVVNASGALQNGKDDQLKEIHESAIERIIESLNGSKTKFIQISAAGVSADSSTDFLRSKFKGDTLISNSNVNWFILRPTLIIGQNAYGGSALLRAKAGTPFFDFQICPNTLIQTVGLNDVATAVLQCADGQIKQRTIADLTESERHTFAELDQKLRSWLGYSGSRIRFKVPNFALKPICKIADILGWLGWKSPLRSNGFRVLEQGVIGSTESWATAGGQPCNSLDQTLSSMPASIQEKWFARVYLLFPVSIFILAVFWFASGLIGLLSKAEAIKVLTTHGLSTAVSQFAVVFGSIIDIILGCLILYRPLARLACWGMITTSLSYLLAASLLTPDLWIDPLGPLVKVLPSICLTMLTASILDKR